MVRKIVILQTEKTRKMKISCINIPFAAVGEMLYKAVYMHWFSGFSQCV